MSIVKDDKQYLWHPFTQMKTAPSPLPIVKGQGAYLYSEEGKSYLDGIASWWTNLHGHSHPYIAQAIYEQSLQLEHVLFADCTHPSATTLAKRLLALLPKKFSKVFYSDNGSTAVECALKMAFQYWFNLDPNTKKKKVICFTGSYHGDTFGAMSASGKNDFNKPFWSHLFPVAMLDVPTPQTEEKILKEFLLLIERDDVACFLFEPLVLGAGGMRMYCPLALDKLITLCKKHNVLTIADEVMTGFGRTGSLFACEYLTSLPDIICLSKGITGGFLPLAATVCTEEIFHAFLGDTLHQALLHGHSYTANPLACTSALASLDLLLDPSCLLQRTMIAHNHAMFCQKWQNHPKLVRCESLGTILALEYKVDDSSYFSRLRDQLYLFFLSKGILLRPLGNVLYVLPPYCITSDELHRIYHYISHTLEGLS